MRHVRLPRDPRRILLIKPSSLGDVVHAIPAFNLLRRRFPNARISWLIAPACAGIIDGLPGLDELILFHRRRYGSFWKDRSVLGEISDFLTLLRQRRFDLVIDLQGLARSGALALLTGAETRVGFSAAREGAWACYTHAIHVGSPEQHAVERYLKVMAAIGCHVDRVDFSFPIDDSHRAAVRELLGGAGRYAVLMPGTNWLTKRWPADRFGQLGEMLERRLGLRAVLAGGPDALALAPHLPSALNLAGKTDLKGLVALLEGASLVVANDSGPMHIAAALGVPLVAVYGPTNPVRTGPFGRMDSVIRLDMPCSPCYSRRCSHTSCMNWLGAERVFEAAQRQLLANNTSQFRAPTGTAEGAGRQTGRARIPGPS